MAFELCIQCGEILEEDDATCWHCGKETWR
jgi:RNA polymerase subunit RPABC4/transcription elongation factor Spt4